MLTPSNPLGTPGFFQAPTMPQFGGILPGTIGGPVSLPKVSKKDQEEYIKGVMAGMMAGMQELQVQFATYLGAPLPVGLAGMPFSQVVEKKDKK